jgi:hypothetical protein
MYSPPASTIRCGRPKTFATRLRTISLAAKLLAGRSFNSPVPLCRIALNSRWHPQRFHRIGHNSVRSANCATSSRERVHFRRDRRDHSSRREPYSPRFPLRALGLQGLSPVPAAFELPASNHEAVWQNRLQLNKVLSPLYQPDVDAPHLCTVSRQR